MIERMDITIPALTGERTRKAYVYLPTTFRRGEDRRYPVIYMFDGHNLFLDSEATYGRSWRLADYLDYTDTQVIIAAVECNTVGNGRLEEYSPYNFTLPDDTKIRGKGKIYMDWLVNEFKPFIDSRYPTKQDKANTAICGSSMGGLMSLYAFSAYAKVFGRAAALSPSLWIKGGILPCLKKVRQEKESVLYMDCGSRELANHAEQQQLFASTAECLLAQGLNLTARIVPGGVHSESSWQQQIPIFMSVLGFNPGK